MVAVAIISFHQRKQPVEKAVLAGKIPVERIDDACERILAVKEKMGFFEEQEEVAMTPELKQEISDFTSMVAQRDLCLQCNNTNLLPLDPKKIKNVAILCFSHTDYFSEALNVMKGEFEKRGMKVRLQRRVASYEEMQEISDENDLIIYAAYVAPHAPMGGSGLFCDECKALFYALTAGREKSIGVSIFSPYVYYDYFESMDTYIHSAIQKKLKRPLGKHSLEKFLSMESSPTKSLGRNKRSLTQKRQFK